MPLFPMSLTRPARKRLWVQAVAVAVATACLGVDLAQADPLFENAAEGGGSVAEILLPGGSESGDDAATVVDWIENSPAWVDEPVGVDEPVAENVDAVGEVVEPEEPLVAIEEPISDDPIQSSLEVGGEDGVQEEVKPPAEELIEKKPIAISDPIEDDDTISPPGSYIWLLPTETACFFPRDVVSTISDGDGEEGSGVLERVCDITLGEITLEWSLPWDPTGGGYQESLLSDVEGLEPVDVRYYAMRDAGAEGPITPTPGPLPVAAALAGWSSARRLRRRCKDRPQG